MADTTTITTAVAQATLTLDSIQHLATSEAAQRGLQWIRNYVRAVAVGDGGHADMDEQACECECYSLPRAGKAALEGDRANVLDGLREYATSWTGVL